MWQLSGVLIYDAVWVIGRSEHAFLCQTTLNLTHTTTLPWACIMCCILAAYMCSKPIQDGGQMRNTIQNTLCFGVMFLRNLVMLSQIYIAWTIPCLAAGMSLKIWIDWIHIWSVANERSLSFFDIGKLKRRLFCILWTANCLPNSFDYPALTTSLITHAFLWMVWQVNKESCDIITLCPPATFPAQNYEENKEYFW